MLTLPPEEGIMPYECCHFTTTHGESDTAVDNIGEVRDAVLKVVTDDLHDACALLNNRDFWREVHFRCAINETIRWLRRLSDNYKSKCKALTIRVSESTIRMTSPTLILPAA